MAGVGGLSSLGLFLLLLLASSSAAREERPSKRTWGEVTAEDLEKYNYLALMACGETRLRGATTYCSGSIISPSAVLTYCEKDPSIAYAGLLAVADVNKTNGNIQKRDVTTVKKDGSPVVNMKICIVAKWDLGTHVNTIKLNLNAKREAMTGCEVLGFRKKGVSEVAYVMKNTTISATKETCKLDAQDGILFSKVTAKDTEGLDASDLGGPVVCAKVQHAINKEFKEEKTEEPKNDACNLYINVNVAKYSDWIKKNTPQDSGENQGPNGNNTVASTGSSIHGYMKKNSEWKVLGFLVPIIVTFLQY